MGMVDRASDQELGTRGDPLAHDVVVLGLADPKSRLDKKGTRPVKMSALRDQTL